MSPSSCSPTPCPRTMSASDRPAAARPRASGGTTIEVPPLRRDRRVQAWVVSTGISQAGDVAWMIGLAWTAAKIGSATETGLVVGIGTLPRALMLLFGGALADRLDARRVMVADERRAHPRAASPVRSSPRRRDCRSRSWSPLRCCSASSTRSTTRRRARCRGSSCAPKTSRRRRRCSSSSRRIATFVGAPIGGVLVAFGGLELVMLVDAATLRRSTGCCSLC